MSSTWWYDEGCPCSRCQRKGAVERYSLGVYAGRWCNECWRASGYRDAPASAFSEADAGERMDPEPTSTDGEDW